MFYVYEWYNIDTKEIFYVGKGSRNRYRVKKHNKLFNKYISENRCSSRIIKKFNSESEAFDFEFLRVHELQRIGQCSCNIHDGGFGGTSSSWTDEKRLKYSVNNVMKSESQRKRMISNNPMKDPNISKKVASKLIRPIYVDGIVYKTCKEASQIIGVTEMTIRNWIRNKKHHSFYLDGNYIKSCSNRKHSDKLSSMAKSVIVDGIYFESIASASEHLGVKPSNLRTALEKDNGEHIYKGHKCKYANQQPSRESYRICVSRKAQRLEREKDTSINAPRKPRPYGYYVIRRVKI